jgi:hypothetical protein
MAFPGAGFSECSRTTAPPRTKAITRLSAKAEVQDCGEGLFRLTELLFDYSFAGVYHLEKSNPDFGQGAMGYFHWLGTASGDQVTGSVLTEGLFPIILHEDPRYSRTGHGSTLNQHL